MYTRQLEFEVIQALKRSPAVALLGPRQVGKTTLALAVGEAMRGSRAPLYLDLESEADRGKLSQPELYLADHSDELVILDEIHRVPGLFPVLRGLIDKGRRAGQRSGKFLLLGSASMDLLAQAGESLAGRIAYLELAPLTLAETTGVPADNLWLRGGFPESLLATTDADSLAWRRDFVRTYVERDALQFRLRLNPEQLRRLWTMLAHQQGGLLNSAALSRSLGVDVKAVNRLIDLLAQLMLVRRLQPWHVNSGKRLVRSPKLYVRDSGILHALLGIADREVLLSHPALGASWETWVIDNLLAAAGPDVQAHFYRTAVGAEVDLLLTHPDGKQWAVEIKRSLSPKLERGFHHACADLQPHSRWLVYPGASSWPLADGVQVVPLSDLMAALAKCRATGT
jgi:predicted AAA+ superfamily ATPase